MRWLMAATLMMAGVQVVDAQLVDPTTGVIVDATADPADFNAVVGGKPGNMGTELAPQAAAQAQQAAAQAMEQAQKSAAAAIQRAQQDAKAFADTASQNAPRATASSAPPSASPGSRPAHSTAARPVIMPKGGIFHIAPGDAVLVTIKEKNPDAKIYYTTDGSRPTLQSLVYSGPIAVSRSETIKVLATGEYTDPSGVVTETFKIKQGTGGLQMGAARRHLRRFLSSGTSSPPRARPLPVAS